MHKWKYGHLERALLQAAGNEQERNPMCAINELNENTYKKLLSVKSIDWSNENECRALYVLKNSDVSSLSAEVYFNTESKSDEKMYKLHGHVQTNDLRTLCAEKFILKKCEPSVIYLGLRMKWSDKQRLINIARKFNIKVYQMSKNKILLSSYPKKLMWKLITSGLRG